MPDVIQPVAETLIHPPLGVCRPHLQPELLTGVGHLPRFAQPENGISYGAYFTIEAIPDHLGRTSSNRPVYDLPLLTLTFLERLQTGVAVPSWAVAVHQEQEVVRWFSFPLAAVEYYVLPGCSWSWSYLLLS